MPSLRVGTDDSRCKTPNIALVRSGSAGPNGDTSLNRIRNAGSGARAAAAKPSGSRSPLFMTSSSDGGGVDVARDRAAGRALT